MWRTARSHSSYPVVPVGPGKLSAKPSTATVSSSAHFIVFTVCVHTSLSLAGAEPCGGLAAAEGLLPHTQRHVVRVCAVQGRSKVSCDHPHPTITQHIPLYTVHTPPHTPHTTSHSTHYLTLHTLPHTPHTTSHSTHHLTLHTPPHTPHTTSHSTHHLTLHTPPHTPHYLTLPHTPHTTSHSTHHLTLHTLPHTPHTP